MTITIPWQLSDGELTAAVSRCSRDERGATAQLVAHLAEFDARRLYLGAGYSSLFAYCREVLGLSEDAAFNRIEAARACRLFPVILGRLADGTLTVTTVRLLARHLTGANHLELLAAADRRGKREVEELVTRRFPKPDTPASVRKVPERPVSVPREPVPETSIAGDSTSVGPLLEGAPTAITAPSTADRPTAFADPAPDTTPVRRSSVKPLAAERYEIRFTAGSATRDKLRVAQDLLRHVVPTGDVAAIVDRALTALIDELSRKKIAIVRRPKAERGGPLAGSRRVPPAGSRHVPAEVRRDVWIRDGGRCAFLGAGGHRCSERAFLEYHHVRPYAVGGEATRDNIQLRCRAHNAHEADLFYGTGRKGEAGVVREAPVKYAVSWDFAHVPERVPRADAHLETNSAARAGAHVGRSIIPTD